MQNKEIDFYAVLDIAQNATPEEIVLAYRKYAVNIHPKRNKNFDHVGSAFGQMNPNSLLLNLPECQRWIYLNKAYDVLSNPLRRQVYDRYGENGLETGVPLPNGYFHPYVYHGNGHKTYHEVFGKLNPYASLIDATTNLNPLYKNDCNLGLREKAKDVVIYLDLTLEEINTETIKRIKIDTEQKVFFVKIPPGILDGTKIVYCGQGGHSPLVDAPDVVFLIRTLNHPVYTRKDSDLHCQKTISLLEALCGGSIKITTLDGRKFRYAFYEVMKNDSMLRIPNEGLPLPNDPEKRGALYITCSIELPKAVPCEVKDKLTQLIKEI